MNIDYSILPYHMQQATKLYIENGIAGGSFLTAIMENDFLEACKCADIDNQRALFEWGKFLYTIPMSCYGSPEKVEKWIERGGLLGKRPQMSVVS